MALEVGELVAFLRLDDKEFQSKLSSSGGALQRFGQGAQRVLQPVATGFAAGTTAAAGLATALLSQGVAYNTLQQSSRAALTTILGSAEKANAQMDKLDDFARNSPFAKQVFIEAQQQLLGFGVAADDVIPALGSIQDAVAAVGGSNEDISAVTYAFAQMQGQGKLTGETLNQLGQYGIDAATIIGDEMGKSGQEIRDMASKPGGIPVDQVWGPLVNGLTEKFGGAAENVKNTWVGAVDRIKGATRDIGSLLAAPFVDPNGGGKALDWANAFADLLRAVEDQAGPLIEVLLPKILPLADAITARLEDAADAVAGLDMDQLIAQLGGVGEYAVPLAAVAAALFAMGTQAAPIQALGLSLNPVAAALVAIIAASPDARGAVLDLLSALSELKDEAGELLVAAGDLGNVLLDGLVQILGAVTGTATETGGAIDLLELGLDGLTGAVQLVTGVAEPLLGFLADLIGAASGAEGPILAVVAALTLMRGVDVGGVIGKLTDALSVGKETWGASKATLEALGQEAGIMNTAMMTARSGVTSLTGAVKGLVVANAPMLAIAGLAAVIGTFVQQAAEADARADQLISTFDELTGAATADTDQMILTQLNEQLSAADWTVLKEMGYSYQEIVDVIKEGGPALEEYIEQVNIARASEHGWSAESDARGDALSRLNGAMRDTGNAYGVAADQASELAAQNEALADSVEEAEAQASSTTDALRTFEDALATLSDEASSAEQRLDALNDILDLMAGGAPSVTEATLDHADALRDITAAAEEFGFSQSQLNDILADDGSLNLQSEAVSALRGEMETLVGASQRQAEALIQAGDEAGAIQVYKDLESDLRAVAQAAGVENPAAIDALVASFGLLPPEVMVDLQMNGVDASEESIQMVQQRLTELPDEVLTFINGDTSGLETKVDESGLRMAYVASLRADPMIGADDKENLSIVAAATARLNELDGMEPTPEIDAEKRALERVVAGAKLDLDSIPDKEAEVIAKTFGFGSLDEMKRAIDRVQSKTVTVTVRTVGTQSTITAGRVRGVSAQADGGVYPAPGVKAFANGGEHHVAQIAPAGAWRVWAEEETGGEAYVPLALAKRARSLAIMHDVAARFGHVMVPVQARRFADGAVASASVQPVPASVDTRAIAAAVAGAISSYQPIVAIGDREFVGVMRRAGRLGAK